MIGVPTNLNSVYVSMVQNGCLKSELDSTYPIHLNGIISQQEFQESINKINRTISSNKIFVIAGGVFSLSLIVGIILFIVGGLVATESYTYRYSLIGVGIALTTIGPMFFSIACCFIQSGRTTRIRQAIAEESMKYSSRSPIPCSWRLDIIRNWAGGYRYHGNTQAAYHLVIDIGRSIAPGSENGVYYSNLIAPEQTVFFGRQDNYLPPPYSGQSNVGTCSQCGVLRHDLMAKYCSSCGQVFNKY